MSSMFFVKAAIGLTTGTLILSRYWCSMGMSATGLSVVNLASAKYSPVFQVPFIYVPWTYIIPSSKYIVSVLLYSSKSPAGKICIYIIKSCDFVFAEHVQPDVRLTGVSILCWKWSREQRFQKMSTIIPIHHQVPYTWLFTCFCFSAENPQLRVAICTYIAEDDTSPICERKLAAHG